MEQLTARERELIATGSLTDGPTRDQHFDFFRALRKGAPIFFDEKLGSWLVTRNAALFSDLPRSTPVHRGDPRLAMFAAGTQRRTDAQRAQHANGR